MKKIFSLFCLLLLSTVAVFCQETSAVVDTSTIIGIGATIIGALLGHFAIPTKWASPIKYILLASKGITWLLTKVNNSNAGEQILKARDIQPPIQPPTAKAQ
jgi:hypothetical protein